VQEEADRGDVLAPFLSVLDGRAVPYRDLVSAGRRLRMPLWPRRWPVVVCGESHWAVVWDLERLTDGEAVDWGLWGGCDGAEVGHPSGSCSPDR
jgi:hypothetical protein